MTEAGKVCCGGETRAITPGEGCCGGNEFFNKESQGCCIDQVYDKNTHYCCGGNNFLKRLLKITLSLRQLD